MKKILLIKTSSLGDILHVFPVLDYLRQIYPEAQIDWVVEEPFAPLLEAHPGLTQVLAVNTHKWRKNLFQADTWKEMAACRLRIRAHCYDLVLDLQGNVKSALLLASTRSALKVGFGYQSVPEWPNLLFTHARYNPPKGSNIRTDYLFLARSAVGNWTLFPSGKVALKITSEQLEKVRGLTEAEPLKGGWKLLVCPGSNWKNKQLPLPVLTAFLEKIRDRCEGRFLFVWGTPAERLVCEQLQAHFSNHSLVLEKQPIPVLQHVMDQMDGVIAMDSLPLHLAGTTSTPSYALFGASSALKYGPPEEGHAAFQGCCPYGQSFEKRCPKLRSCPTGSCIRELDAGSLFDHFYFFFYTSLDRMS